MRYHKDSEFGRKVKSYLKKGYTKKTAEKKADDSIVKKSLKEMADAYKESEDYDLNINRLFGW